jgi:type IV pilus assembly protein PilW
MSDPKLFVMMRPRRSRRVTAQARGLSIIELMVGIVVALLVGLAAAGSAMMFTASQRQGIGTGGTTVNVGTVLSALKNDTANAGLGFFGDNQFLCNALNLSVDANVVSDAASFAPLRITRDGANDIIDAVYSSQVHAGANVLLRAASNGSSAELMSLLPVAAGQAVLLAPAAPASAASAAAVDPCVVRTVTAVTASTEDTPQVLAFAAAASHNAAAFSAAMNYPERSRVALLGELRWNRYRVDNNRNLLLERPMEGTSAVLARNVIGFRAQYGITDGTPNRTSIDSWQNAEGADFAVLDSDAIGRVRALRLGIVTRSPQREKPDPAGNCVASDAKPQLFGTTVEPDVAAWGCYRYRTTTTVLPLRNLVMGIK